jgi:membrane-associated HD superfamily phosphohydrolase
VSTDRLDRIEALLATVAESNAASTQRLDRIEAIQSETAAGLREVRAITESNARAIEAWGDRIEEGMAEAEAVSSAMAANTNRRMEEAITDTVSMIANLGRQQQDTDQRFEVFLAEARADRAEMRAAREANSTEHRAFTQNIQVLLAEIARLWQRVAG